MLAMTRADASRGGPPGYPKTMIHTSRIRQFTEAERETLSWYDQVSCKDPPDMIAELRERNPHQILFFRTMPQNFVRWNEGDTWWHADTSWSITRLAQFYAEQNDWYLYDIYGERIEEWGGYAANWTRHCPEGTYGTSRGMTYPEWYVNVAMPQVAYHSPDLEPWGWSSSAYQGFEWEFMVDCPACCQGDLYMYADPNRDGVAEGIDTNCWDGGWDDPLSNLYREVNEYFYERLRIVLEPDLILRINRGGKYMNPEWAWDMHGLKLEHWRPDRVDHAPSTWWSYFYGRRLGSGELLGDGYEFAERVMHPFGVDEREGWDMTLIQVWEEPDWDVSFTRRMQRWGIGTAMLGDGYFTTTVNQHDLYWLEEFDWEFGDPLGDFGKEVMGVDTLYVRLFENGFIEVNPYEHYVGGVSPQNTRFAFWMTLDDIAVTGTGFDAVALGWTVPVGEHWIDSTYVRYATYPITAENWDTCAEAPAGGAVGLPGQEISYIVGGLDPETTYYFAAKNLIYGRLEPHVSNVVSTTTQAAPDGAPPAAVDDLEATDVGPTWAALGWTATGDDGHEGLADHYQLRYLEGRAITTEGDWQEATAVAVGLPEPGPPGTAETFLLSTLEPETSYGICVRVVDDESRMSDLSNPLLVATPAPPDTVPPGAIDDLEAEALVTALDLAWTSPGDDGDEGTASGYILGYREGEAIVGEVDWEAATRITSGLPAPAAAGTPQAFRLEDLTAETSYGLALRAFDDADNLSSLGPPLVATTHPAPDTLPPGAVEDLAGTAAQTAIELSWPAPGDDGDTGRAATYLLRFRVGEAIETEADWEAAEQVTEGLPEPADAGTAQSFDLEGLQPATAYGICLRAMDEVENLAPLSVPLLVETLGPPDLTPPSPIHDLVPLTAFSDGFDLAWTAPGDDGASGTAASYILGVLEGRVIAEESDWQSAALVTDELPTPEVAGTEQTFHLSGLEPDRHYGLSLRARDEADNLSSLGAPLLAQTLPEDDPGDGPGGDPDSLAPAAIGDLTLADHGTTWARLTWSCPGDDGDEGIASAFVLGFDAGTELTDEEAWEAAEKVTAGLPEPDSAGVAVAYRLEGLQPAEGYNVVVRAIDDADLLSPLHPPLVFTTDALPDTIPPARVEDLTAAEVGESWVLLTWTAVGDDGTSGQAGAYALGALADETVADENWDDALLDLDDLPAPAPAGEAESYLLTGLDPASAYGVAMRTSDAAGNGSELSNTLHVETPASPPPPDAVLDLIVTGIGAAWIDITWTAPAAHDAGGSAAAYEIACVREEITPEAWAELPKLPAPPTPAAAGNREHLRVSALESDETYWVALRSADEAGRWSDLSNVVTVSTPAEGEEDREPPAPPNAPLADVNADRHDVTLTWLRSLEDDVLGYHVYGRSADRTSRDRLTDVVVQETNWSFELPDRTRNYFVSLSAVDRAGNESAWGAEVAVLSEALDLRGPFPHPIEDEGRFQLVLPPDASGRVSVKARIFSASGQLVRRWIDEAFPPGGEVTLTWDTRNDHGARVAPGLYFLKLEAGTGAKLTKVYVRRP